MMFALSQTLIREAACAALSEQAYVDKASGVLGIPVRRAGEDYAGGHADQTFVLEVLHFAAALRWTSTELTAWTVEATYYFALARPGHHDDDSDEQVVVANPHLERALQRVACRDLGSIDDRPAMWLMTCPAADCDDTPRWPHADRAEVEYLAWVHDGLHHHGALTAEVTPVAHAQVAWEVDDPQGKPIYLGFDAELASDMYQHAPAGSHLLPAPPSIAEGRF